MTVLCFIAVAVFLIVGLCPEPPRPAMIVLPRPTTWQQFLRTPVPLKAEDVPMRSSHADTAVATVYNHAAAVQLLRRHNAARPR